MRNAGVVQFKTVYGTINNLWKFKGMEKLDSSSSGFLPTLSFGDQS